MNILIVGNGFDLSHYLPTKYDHFMDVMGAIEEKETGGLPDDLSVNTLEEWLKQIDGLFEHREDMAPPPHHMKFDELFNKTRDPKFIGKTKEYYLTENIEICAKDVLKLQYRLEMNSWYQYFSDHVREVKTWIDFEQKIEHVLLIIGEKLFDCEMIDSESAYLEYFNGDSGIKAKVNNFDIKILDQFKLIVKEVRIRNMKPVSPKYSNNQPIHAPWWNINKEFCYGNKLENGFSVGGFINYLMDQLEEFIKIFDRYLELVISQLNLKCLFKIESECWKHPDKIFSFNYTNTFQRIHDSVKIEFLHGRHGEQQNIVLGISDLENDALKKLKAYGFTKYHQKLFKDTDYLFLDKLKEKVKNHKRRIEYFEKDFGDKDPIAKKFERQ